MTHQSIMPRFCTLTSWSSQATEHCFILSASSSARVSQSNEMHCFYIYSCFTVSFWLDPTLVHSGVFFDTACDNWNHFRQPADFRIAGVCDLWHEYEQWINKHIHPLQPGAYQICAWCDLRHYKAYSHRSSKNAHTRAPTAVPPNTPRPFFPSCPVRALESLAWQVWSRLQVQAVSSRTSGSVQAWPKLSLTWKDTE